MPEIGSGDNDRNADTPVIQSQVESLAVTRVEPTYPPLFVANQTDFTEPSITKNVFGNLETIFTEQE